MVYWGLTPQQQPGSYQGGEMMMKSVIWWRKPEYPEETTDLWQVTDETFHTYGLTVQRVKPAGFESKFRPVSSSPPVKLTTSESATGNQHDPGCY